MSAPVLDPAPATETSVPVNRNPTPSAPIVLDWLCVPRPPRVGKTGWTLAP